MKNLAALLFLLAASCTDLVHYISFDHEGGSLQVLRITVQKNYLRGDVKTQEALKNMGAFRMRSPNYFISSSPLDNGAEYGFELRYTAKAGYLAPQNTGIVPASEPFGFSFTLDPLESVQEPDENSKAWLDGVKYRILLSKRGIKPLWRVEVAAAGGVENKVAVSEFDSFYMIEFPLSVWLFNPQETKINFYLR